MPDQNPDVALTPEEAAAGIRKYRNAEEQDLARLKEAINRTPDEKFSFLMGLMRLQKAFDRSVLSKKSGNESFDDAYIKLWKCLNESNVRYIMIGDFATNFYGFRHFTGNVDIYLEDTVENRRKLRQAYNAYGMGDFPSFETMQFIPGWVDFPLQNGARLDIMTSMKGIDASFDECLALAPKMTIRGEIVPVLHINHLLANKKAIARLKDQLDVQELEKIKKLLEEDNPEKES